MPTEPRFGGEWTERKLRTLDHYLEGYCKIFTQNPRARYFATCYVDAFAGTGYRHDPGPDPNEESVTEAAFRQGSANVALKHPFHRFVFIERSVKRAAELRRLQEEHSDRGIEVWQDDANDALNQWIHRTDWQRTRAVVFLDPFGMQVDWSTIQALGATGGVDLWWLFPLGIGVMRLLTRKKAPPPEWERALTRIYGTDDWKTRFYERSPQGDLFQDAAVERQGDWRDVARYTVERLEAAFHRAHRNPAVLRNSTGSPMYLLCFAASNPAGATPALNIAGYLLDHIND